MAGRAPASKGLGRLGPYDSFMTFTEGYEDDPDQRESALVISAQLAKMRLGSQARSTPLKKGVRISAADIEGDDDESGSAQAETSTSRPSKSSVDEDDDSQEEDNDEDEDEDEEDDQSLPNSSSSGSTRRSLGNLSMNWQGRPQYASLSQSNSKNTPTMSTTNSLGVSAPSNRGRNRRTSTSNSSNSSNNNNSNNMEVGMTANGDYQNVYDSSYEDSIEGNIDGEEGGDMSPDDDQASVQAINDRDYESDGEENGDQWSSSSSSSSSQRGNRNGRWNMSNNTHGNDVYLDDADDDDDASLQNSSTRDVNANQGRKEKRRSARRREEEGRKWDQGREGLRQRPMQEGVSSTQGTEGEAGISKRDGSHRQGWKGDGILLPQAKVVDLSGGGLDAEGKDFEKKMRARGTALRNTVTTLITGTVASNSDTTTHPPIPLDRRLSGRNRVPGTLNSRHTTSTATAPATTAQSILSPNQGNNTPAPSAPSFPPGSPADPKTLVVVSFGSGESGRPSRYDGQVGGYADGGKKGYSDMSGHVTPNTNGTNYDSYNMTHASYASSGSLQPANLFDSPSAPLIAPDWQSPSPHPRPHPHSHPHPHSNSTHAHPLPPPQRPINFSFHTPSRPVPSFAGSTTPDYHTATSLPPTFTSPSSYPSHSPSPSPSPAYTSTSSTPLSSSHAKQGTSRPLSPARLAAQAEAAGRAWQAGLLGVKSHTFDTATNQSGNGSFQGVVQHSRRPDQHPAHPNSSYAQVSLLDGERAESARERALVQEVRAVIESEGLSSSTSSSSSSFNLEESQTNKEKDILKAARLSGAVPSLSETPTTRNQASTSPTSPQLSPWPALARGSQQQSTALSTTTSTPTTLPSGSTALIASGSRAGLSRPPSFRSGPSSNSNGPITTTGQDSHSKSSQGDPFSFPSVERLSASQFATRRSSATTQRSSSPSHSPSRSPSPFLDLSLPRDHPTRELQSAILSALALANEQSASTLALSQQTRKAGALHEASSDVGISMNEHGANMHAGITKRKPYEVLAFEMTMARANSLNMAKEQQEQLKERLRSGDAKDDAAVAMVAEENKSLHNARQARRAELTNALASRIESLTSARSRLQVAVSNTTKLRDAWNRGSAEQDSMTVDTFKQAEAAVRVHDQAVFDAANACDQAVAALRTIGVEAKSGADEARNNRHAANAVAELRTLRGRAILRDALKSKQHVEESMKELVRLGGEQAKNTPEYIAAARSLNMPAPVVPPGIKTPSAAQEAKGGPVSAPAGAASGAAAPVANVPNPVLVRAKQCKEALAKVRADAATIEEKLGEYKSALNAARRECDQWVSKTVATRESVEKFGGKIIQRMKTPVNGVDPVLFRSFIFKAVAEAILKQGDTRITAHGHLAYLVCAEVPEFLPVLLGAFYDDTPLTIPYVPTRAPDVPEEKFRVAGLGFKVDDKGLMESTDTFLNRVDRTLRLYLAFMTISMRNYRTPHPHGTNACWTWLAATLNLQPGIYTPTMLAAFITVSGAVMIHTYPRQMRKIMVLIAKHIIPKLKAMPENLLGQAGVSHRGIVEQCLSKGGHCDPLPGWMLDDNNAGIDLKPFSQEDIESSRHLAE